MEKKIKIGLIGLGTVGTGVVKVLENFDNIEIKAVAVHNINKPRAVEVKNITDDAFTLVNDPDIDIIVEVMGGCDPTLKLLETAIKNGKHIVTANKELLARHGAYLFDLANEYNKVILYEAAVAGGIPIIMPIKTTMRANNFESVAGILNGTTNYILSKMEEEGLSYEECLKKAQELGYAETNPTSDVEGYDAMYKIATLANITFHKRIDINKIYREGITKITKEDIECANELGYKIKLIGLAKRTKTDEIDVRVHPMLVKKQNMMAKINNALNAVLLKGQPIGEVVFSGPGAGEMPTASSVVGDILVLASEINMMGNILPMTRCNHSELAKQINISETENNYYISITAKNLHGIIGIIGTACGKNNINILSILQKGLSDDHRSAKVIVITEKCLEKDIQNAIKELEAIVQEDEKCIQINNLIRVME
ncbi:MAG: homoserine dehydrogenase [Cyanobacteria bacterium SIG30]|nr:homoserine dehydrogenase [Cyanobacteria bacterium SIG30]